MPSYIADCRMSLKIEKMEDSIQLKSEIFTLSGFFEMSKIGSPF